MHTHTHTLIRILIHTRHTHTRHTHTLKVVSSCCKVFNLASTCASVAKRQKLPQSTSLSPLSPFLWLPALPLAGSEYQANCKNKNNYTFLLLQLTWKPNWKWTSHKKLPFRFIFAAARQQANEREREREKEGARESETAQLHTWREMCL